MEPKNGLHTLLNVTFSARLVLFLNSYRIESNDPRVADAEPATNVCVVVEIDAYLAGRPHIGPTIQHAI
jgi:hypothetical protein